MKERESLSGTMQEVAEGIEYLTGHDTSELLLQVFNSTTIPFLVTHPASGRIIYSNTAFCKLFNYTPDELQKVSSEHLYLCGEHRKDLLNALYTKQEVDWMDVEGKTKEGKRLLLRVSLKLTRFQNNEAILVAFDTITEKRELKEALTATEMLHQSLINVMEEGVIMRMANGTISMANKAAERIYGTPLTQVATNDWETHFNALDENGNALSFSQFPTMMAIESGELQRDKVLRVETPEGNWLWIKMNVVPIFQPNEKSAYACVASFSDITQQKETEKRLRRLHDTKDTLFRVMGHDLRSQITAIMGITDLIELETASLKNDTLKHYLQLLKASATGNFNLLQNLTDWAQTQTSDSQLHPINFFLHDMAKEVVELFAPMISQKQLVVDIAIDEQQQVFVDPNITKALLRNLISNALKYSYAGGNVRIDSCFLGTSFSFTVQDAGVGMKPQLLELLWSEAPIEPQPGTAREKGIGLGLRIVKELVDKHGGTLQVDSAMGLGSAFTITLPQKEENRF
ncbi:MAG: PAS domain-containing sensor histidine kinase [Bacteroidales bacterium]